MNLTTLERISPLDFDEIYAEMALAFPPEERRDREAARAILDDPRYALYHVVHEKERVGFLALWVLDTFTFLEHLVIYPAHRNKGLGGKVITLAKQRFSPFLLECEPPDTEMAARRLAFYRRCGLVQNAHPYLQPSYREGGNGVPLLLMTYPLALTAPTQTVRELYALVYKKDI